MLSTQELAVIDGMDSGKIPKHADLDYFLECNELKPLYSVSKALGLIPSNVKKWADAVEGRYQEIGLFAFGSDPNKRQHYVNVRTFVNWALTTPNTRRQMVRRFNARVGKIKKGMGRREVVDTQQLFIFDELCSRCVIPRPFSTARGRETLIRKAEECRDSRAELGLFKDEQFGEWLVEPERFFKYLVTAYGLVGEGS